MKPTNDWENRFESRFGMLDDPETTRYLCLYNEHLGYVACDKEVKAFIAEEIQRAHQQGRVSVLQDFDNLCKADAFVGFTQEEWQTIKKFFEFNKGISAWDTPTEDTSNQKVLNIDI